MASAEEDVMESFRNLAGVNRFRCTNNVCGVGNCENFPFTCGNTCLNNANECTFFGPLSQTQIIIIAVFLVIFTFLFFIGARSNEIKRITQGEMYVISRDNEMCLAIISGLFFGLGIGLLTYTAAVFIGRWWGQTAGLKQLKIQGGHPIPPRNAAPAGTLTMTYSSPPTQPGSYIYTSSNQGSAPQPQVYQATFVSSGSQQPKSHMTAIPINQTSRTNIPEAKLIVSERGV